MIQHCVLLSLKDPVNPAYLDKAMGLISGLVGKVPGLIDVCHGPNRDFENLSSKYQYGLLVTATGREALEAYGVHPDHVTASGFILQLCEGGIDGVFVADIECSPAQG
ncbi:Dabb family protein [Roseibium denhamense]|uniref:Stress responsive A/B Barrel Domain n=1 Tax=Roseibium denhamense TaxID=76305 RepID=A0ABY1NID4_9HYPH|nr:Dabb family protein [Roseibium denhamense]MTI05031.1 Dabb family protein [Roseibium denhamense]SMP09918.1 Stress responsive A/B Barrel Domain [Roseibium denhamense]